MAQTGISSISSSWSDVVRLLTNVFRHNMFAKSDSWNIRISVQGCIKDSISFSRPARLSFMSFSFLNAYDIVFEKLLSRDRIQRKCYVLLLLCPLSSLSNCAQPKIQYAPTQQALLPSPGRMISTPESRSLSPSSARRMASQLIRASNAKATPIP